MVKGLLADINCEGHLQTLVHSLRTGSWREYWTCLHLVIPTFADFGLAHETPDRLVWQLCQREQLVLVTANRNARGAESLEETIRTLNTPDCLPVITLAAEERILRERSYAERAALRLLDLLFDIDRRRGSGRLFIP